jgi:ligand-binding sensor domain-containing protein
LSALAIGVSCNGQIADGKKNVAHKSALSVGDTVSDLDKTIFIVFQAKNNIFWFGSDGKGVYRYDGNMLLHFTSEDGLCHDRIRGIQEDEAGNIFFTTLGGICKFDGQKFTTLPVATSGEWKSEPGDLWFASNQDENGAYRYDGKSLYHLEFPKHYLADEFYKRHPDPPYNPYQVYSVYKDSKGNIWFGTSTFGICRYNGKSLSWMYEKHLTQIGNEGSFGIRSITEDKDGEFWFCNTRYRYTIYPDDSIGQTHRFILYQRQPGISNLTAPDGSDLIYYMSVASDNQHDLWMATYGVGVWRYDGKNITRYPVKDGSKDIRLYSVYKDRRGDLWLGTHDAGAYKFNGTSFEKFRP